MQKTEAQNGSPARNFNRAMAYFLDSLVASACSLVVWFDAMIYQKQTATMGYSIRLILAFFVVYFFYHFLFVYFLGGTPGKLIMGLRIVNKNKQSEKDSAGPAGLSLMQVFLRVLADQLSIFFGHGLRMLVLLRLDRTHVSDWVAETQVVQLSPRKEVIKRHVFWAIVLCFFLSTSSFMKLYSQFQKISVVGERVFFQTSGQ